MTRAIPNPKGRKCQWCGCDFAPANNHQGFCCASHQQEFGNWCASRGKVLFPLAMAWRSGRGSKSGSKEAMQEMCRFLDQCAAELSSRNAPSMLQHYTLRRKTHPIIPWADKKTVRPQRERMKL